MKNWDKSISPRKRLDKAIKNYHRWLVHWRLILSFFDSFVSQRLNLFASYKYSWLGAGSSEHFPWPSLFCRIIRRAKTFGTVYRSRLQLASVLTLTATYLSRTAEKRSNRFSPSIVHGRTTEAVDYVQLLSRFNGDVVSLIDLLYRLKTEIN